MQKRLLLLQRFRGHFQTEVDRRFKGAKLNELYPDEGPLRRELYPKHLEFFRVGAQYRERCAMCANRIGKTLGMGGYEMALHLTGLYPSWWDGRRFNQPIEAWAAGKTNQTTRDVPQAVLLGKVIRSGKRRVMSGSGLIPAGLLGVPVFYSAGATDLVDAIAIRYATGGWSHLGFKSFTQRRGAFEGVAKHVIWLDEEPDITIYEECLIRTATTNGIIMLTFTPLEGMTATVLQFLPAHLRPQIVKPPKALFSQLGLGSPDDSRGLDAGNNVEPLFKMA